MAEIRPFRGIRPRPDLVSRVASPPYDVLSSQEARETAKGNPLSFLHVNKAEIDLPADVDAHSEQVYRLSAKNFERMQTDGVFIRDESPCFYVYRLKMGEHAQTGLVAGASVDEYESGAIKKHELTRREKEDDRARHVEIMKANAGPVLFTYRRDDAIREIITRVSSAHPVYDFTADDGIGHTLWIVADETDIAQLRHAFRSVDALYVADGHHRTASAFRVRNIMRDKNPAHTGEEEYNYFLTVLFPDDQLRIMGYHRVVKDLNGLSPDDFLAAMREKFDLDTTTEPEPDRLHDFGMFLDRTWYRLRAKQGSFPPDDPVRSLDASILQENLLAPVLDIDDPRTDNRIDFVGGIRGMAGLEKRCAEDMRVAFALAPVTPAQLMAIADSGAIMPPKSTWFEPKLRSGIVVRSIV
jgi:uncharacterized protein (DUF1015 family)